LRPDEPLPLRLLQVHLLDDYGIVCFSSKKKAGDFWEIPVLDHIILTCEGYYSPFIKIWMKKLKLLLCMDEIGKNN